jgi:hypothetical protein
MARRISVKLSGGESNTGSRFINDDLRNVLGDTGDLSLNEQCNSSALNSGRSKIMTVKLFTLDAAEKRANAHLTRIMSHRTHDDIRTPIHESRRRNSARVHHFPYVTLCHSSSTY